MHCMTVLLADNPAKRTLTGECFVMNVSNQPAFELGCWTGDKAVDDVSTDPADCAIGAILDVCAPALLADLHARLSRRAVKGAASE